MVMLRGVCDGEDDLDVGVEAGQFLRVEVLRCCEIKFVVRGAKRVGAEQSLAAPVGVGAAASDLLPSSACRIVAKFKELERNVGYGTPKRGVEDVG